MIFRFERVLVADWECGIGMRAWGGDVNVTLPTNEHDANDYRDDEAIPPRRLEENDSDR